MFVPSIYFSSKLKAMKGAGNKFLRTSERQRLSLFQVRKSAPDEREPNYCKKFARVFCSPLFWCLLLTKTGVNVMFTVFRLFIPKYLVEVLNAKDVDKAIRTHLYVIIVFTSPYIGSLFSFIFVKAVGGYEKKKAYLVCLLFTFLLAAICIPMPLVEDWKIYMGICFFYHILSAAILPTLNGIIGTCVEPKLRAGASNISKYYTSGLVSGPTPTYYGLMK